MKAARLILAVIAALAAGVGNGSGVTNEVSGLLQKGLFEEEANHDLDAAIRAYQAVVTQTDKDHKFAATAIFRLGECYRKQGKTNEANAAYQRILREFPDQTELATLSRQQLGSATGPVANGSVAGQTTSQREASELTVDVKAFREAEEIKQLQTMLRDSPDLLNLRSSGGSSRLHKAAQDGQLAVAKFLLDNSADVNARDDSRSTALHFAVRSGRKDMVELLLARGANVDAQNREGATPLHYAAQSGFKAIAELLLAHGAAVNAKINSGETSGETPLHEAAHAGNGAIAELLLTNKADVNARDNNAGTPLYIAAEMGHPAVMELLIAHGADINVPRLGVTPLMKAIAQNNTDAAKVLLQHGADIKIQMPKDSPAQTSWAAWAALQFAVDKNNSEMVKLLLDKGADVNLKTQYGKTPLIAAVEGKELEIAKLLLEHGADVNSCMAGNDPDKPRWTALDAAVSLRDNELVKLLLEHHADPNLTFDLPKQSETNATPLMIAVWSRNKETAKTLLANNADVNMKETGGWTALWKAYSFNMPELMELLLDNKANPDFRYYQGKSILHFAAERGDTNLVKLFLAHGADVNLRDDGGMTPLHLAVAAASRPIVEMLLAHGAEVNVKDKHADTPLDVWIKHDSSAPHGTAFTIQPAVSGDGSAPLTYQWQFGGTSETGGEGEDIGALLRKHGGIAEVDVATIRVMRSGQLTPVVVFHRDAGEHNHFTLYEVLVGLYGRGPMTGFCLLQEGDLHNWPRSRLNFPDLSKVKIVHLAEKGRSKADTVNMEKPLGSGDCSGNVALQWGDIIDVPEVDHNVSEAWQGLSQPGLDTLEKCLKRRVKIIVKGMETALTLTPPEYMPPRQSRPGHFDAARVEETRERELSTFWLSRVVQESHLVLVSSDLTRVNVKRVGSGNANNIVVNLEKMGPYSDLWLKDGDVIEIPEKSGE